MRWSFTQKNRVKPGAGGQSGKNLRIASPCSAKWEEMKGTDWMRHCTECNLNVYNFSEMTWKEVERLVASRQGRLCARFYRRADGTMLTQDCPKGLRAVVRRVSRWAGAALSAITVISSAEAQPRSWSEHIERAQAESGEAVGSPIQGEASVAIQVKYPGGAAMSHTRVVLLGSRGEQIRDAITDERGRARLQSLDAGPYRLVVRSSGWEGDPQAFVLGERDAIEVSFTLRPAPLMGDMVAVDAPLIPVERSEPKIDLLAIAERRENFQQPAGVGVEDNAGGKSSPSPSSFRAYASLVLKVKDKRGETIGGAAIILLDSRSGRQWTGVSDSQGNFVVPSLPRGRYMLTVRAAGFSAYFTQVEALRSGEIDLEALLPEAHISGLVDIEEMRRDSAAQESGAEAAFR
jgi:hypothetical protein